MSDPIRPQVVVSVLVEKDGKILMGKRKGTDGTNGMYGVPGGRLEMLESIEECALRELDEETGINADEFRFIGTVNVRKFAPKHFVVVLLHAKWVSGEPENREPDRSEPWEWIDPNAPPDNMTPASRDGLTALLTGQLSFEAET